MPETFPDSARNELIVNIENSFFNASDTVCLDRLRLATEGYRQWADKPVAIKRAQTFRHILRSMQLDLESKAARSCSSMCLIQLNWRMPKSTLNTIVIWSSGLPDSTRDLSNSAPTNKRKLSAAQNMPPEVTKQVFKP